MTNKRDSSAPNSPELTRLSGEQAEERTAREGRECAETQLLDELGLSFHRVGNSLQVTLFDPLKIESLVPADKSYTAHFAMDKAWRKLIEKQAECSRLASRVEELEKGLREYAMAEHWWWSGHEKMWCWNRSGSAFFRGENAEIEAGKVAECALHDASCGCNDCYNRQFMAQAKAERSLANPSKDTPPDTRWMRCSECHFEDRSHKISHDVCGPVRCPKCAAENSFYTFVLAGAHAEEKSK